MIAASSIASSTPHRRPIALPSLAITGLAFAVILLICGGSPDSEANRVQLWCALILLATEVALALLLATREGLFPHFGYLMMLFGVTYWFVAPALTLALSSEQNVGDRYGMTVQPKAIATASLLLATYLFISVLSYWICYTRVKRRFNGTAKPQEMDKFYFLLLGLFLAGFIPYLLFGGGLENFLQALLAGRSVDRPWKSEGALGDHRSAIYYLSLSGMVAAGGMAGTWAVLRRGCKIRPLLAAVFLVTTTLVFLDGGTRSWVALTTIPTVLAWIATSLKRHLTFARLLILVLIICAVQLGFEIARASRTHGWSLARLAAMDFSERKFDNDFFTDVALAVQLVPRKHDYFYFGDVWAFVSHPIPRFVWKNKPISPVLLYYNETVYHGLLHGSGNKLPSHVGQFYMSFGVAGVMALGVLSGVISCFASLMIASPFIAVRHFGCLWTVWWFLMSRGLYPGWTYPILFAWVILAFGFRTQDAVEDENRGRPPQRRASRAAMLLET